MDKRVPRPREARLLDGGRGQGGRAVQRVHLLLTGGQGKAWGQELASGGGERRGGEAV